MKCKSLITIFYLSIICSFAQTTVSGDITGNTTWTSANSPYELNGVVTVAAGVTLTIEPGVEIQATHYSNNLIVNGALVAEGTMSDSIKFTGPFMHIEAVGSGSSFDYVLFDGLGVFNNAALQIFSDDVTVQHSNFETCEVGISVHSNSSPSITDSRFFDSHDYGIRIYDGSPTIENNVIDGQSGSAAGVIIESGKPTIRNNDISNVAQNQTSYGIIIDHDSEAPILENNTFSNNSRDLLTHPHLASDTIFDTNGLSELYIDNKNISQNTTWPLPQSPESYTYVKEGGNTIDAGVTLTIEPGVEVQSTNYTHDIIVNGTLIAEGTETDSITFIGSEIHVEAVSTGTSFDHVIFQSMGAFNHAALQLSTSDVSIQRSNFKLCEVGISIHNDISPVISNCRFFDFHDYGLRVYNGTPILENNVIDGNGGSAGGVIVEGGKPTIRNNDISNVAQNQTSYGIIIDHDGAAPILENNTLSNNSREILTHPHLVNDTIFDTNGISEIYIDNVNITQNTTWHLPQSPESWTYAKEGGNTIDTGVTLTIEPGVEVRSINYTHDIIVNGTLIAEGTETDSITFIGSEIHVEAASSGTSFDHVIFQSMGAFNQAALQLSTSDVSIQHSNFKVCEVGISIHNDISPVISNCRFFDFHDYGLRVYNGTPTVENNVIDGNGGSAGGVIVEGGKPTIWNNDISNIAQNQASYGIIIDHDGAAPILENNTLSNNSREILTHPHLVNDTIFDTNGISEIFIDNVNITQNTTWHLPQSPEYWTYVKEAGNTIDAGATLTIEPGVEVRSTNYTHDIIVNGTLIAEGTTTDSIKFVGSEIHVAASSSGSSFDYVVFEEMGAFNQAGLQLYTNDVSVQHSTFEKCEVGISVHNDISPIISDSRFFDANDYGMRVYGGSPTVENACFESNPFGILNEGSGTVTATNNWWGDPSGPLSTAANPSGLGEEVSDGVTFNPWLTIDPCLPPEISIESQPTNQNVCQEGNLGLSVTVSGTTNLQYQWQENQGAGFSNLSDDATVSGATSSDLTISSVQSSLNGTQYRCMISGDHADDVISDTVSLGVLTFVSIIEQPNSMEITAEEEAVFTVNASGDGLSYQWQKDANDITGANSNSLVIASVGMEDEGLYRCVVSGSCNETTSMEVTLEVCAPVSISSQSSDMVSVCEGENHTFSIAEQGDPTISYEWYKDGTLISAASNSNYELINTNNSDDGQYKVIIINDCGKDSAFFQLDVELDPTISLQPIGQTIMEGESVTLSVEAEGSNLNFQWQKDGSDISGANSNTLMISMVSQADAGAYQCIIENNCGFIDSSIATLTVNDSSNPLNVSSNVERLLLYPNPAVGHFTIRLPNEAGELSSVRICDLSGKQVYSQNVKSNSDELLVETHAFETGTYIVSVYTGSTKVISSTLVIQ